MGMVSIYSVSMVLFGLLIMVAGVLTRQIVGIGTGVLLFIFTCFFSFNLNNRHLAPGPGLRTLTADHELSKTTTALLGSRLASKGICRFEISGGNQYITFYKGCDHPIKEAVPSITLEAKPLPELPMDSILATYSSSNNMWEVSGTPLKVLPTLENYQQRIDDYISLVDTQLLEAENYFERNMNSSGSTTAMNF